MKIKSADSFVLKIPIGYEISDSMQSVQCLEFAGLTISTDTGITGTGYTVTLGHGGNVIQSILDTFFINKLTGKDPFNVREIWQDLYHGTAHWIGRAGATTMAQAAVDIALWDIIAKTSEQPLWRILGGAKSSNIPIYNTHAGWLNFTKSEIIDEALQLIDQGYPPLKMKVGLQDIHEDVHRVAALKNAIPDDILLMVDANQKWDLMQASFAANLFEEFNLSWLEEPLHPDDIKAHKALSKKSNIPIALGEQLYTTHAFRDYIEANAVDVVQVDVCRVGGVTPWLEVAAMANVAGIRVCPHAGDLMQVHQHLVKTIPNNWLLEVIPIWEEGPFKHQISLSDGKCCTPEEPGASTDFTAESFDTYRVS